MSSTLALVSLSAFLQPYPETRGAKYLSRILINRINHLINDERLLVLLVALVPDDGRGQLGSQYLGKRRRVDQLQAELTVERVKAPGDSPGMGAGRKLDRSRVGAGSM